MSQQEIANSLEGKDAATWLEYLRPFEESGTHPGLSTDVMLSYLRVAQDDLEWAEVAVRFLDLEARIGDDSGSQSESLRAMQLRARHIAKVGSRTGHVVLDKDRVVQWAKESLTMSPDEAVESTKRIWDLARKDDDLLRQQPGLMSHLRHMKQRLLVVQTLADCGELSDDPSLDEWLRIKGQLL